MRISMVLKRRAYMALRRIVEHFGFVFVLCCCIVCLTQLFLQTLLCQVIAKKTKTSALTYIAKWARSHDDKLIPAVSAEQGGERTEKEQKEEEEGEEESIKDKESQNTKRKRNCAL
jgi:hypothetical protein